MNGIVTLSFLSWILWFQLAIVVKQTSCEFGFSSQHAFDLTIANKYPTSGEEVTLKCRRKNDVNTVTVGTSLLGSDDNVISWEENDRTVLTTSINQRGGCTVIIDSRFTASSTFDSGRNRLSETSCEYEGSDRTVRLKIKNWTPAHLGGDNWRCSQFPFAESKSVAILSYVPVTSVSIQQDIDRFNTPSRGTIVTCISSPSRPAPNVFWFIENEDGSDVKVTMQADLKENVETDFNGLSVTTSSVLFSHDEDHGTNVFCRTFNKRRVRPIPSDVLAVKVKYPPTVEIEADPGASILEDTDVTLHCIVEGRPTPSIQWIRRGDESVDTIETEDNFMIISLDPVLFLQSVTMKDSGKYECIATNGIGEEVTAPIFLFVREKPVSDENRSSNEDTSDEMDDENDNSTTSTDFAGTIVGSVITIVAIIIIVSVVAFLFIKRRWGKDHNIVGHRPRHSLNSNNDGQAIYATCSSMPGNSELPPYVDVLPPAYKLSNITNPGYEMVDNVIGCIHHTRSPNSKRPLPSTPPPCSDYGYDVIKEGDVDGSNNYLNTTRRPTNAISKSNTVHSCYNNNNGDRYINTKNTCTSLKANYNNEHFNTKPPATDTSNGNRHDISRNSNNYNNTSTDGSSNSSIKHNGDNSTTITTVGSGDSRRRSANSGSYDFGSGGCDVDDADDDDNGYDNGEIGNGGYSKNNSNNSGTLQVRSLRQEYGGYEVPVLPPLEK